MKGKDAEDQDEGKGEGCVASFAGATTIELMWSAATAPLMYEMRGLYKLLGEVTKLSCKIM